VNLVSINAFIGTPMELGTAQKIATFSSLPLGWHYGAGTAISDDNIAAAQSLLDVLLLNGLTRTDAFPGSDGEILLTAYFGTHYIALTVATPDDIAFNHDHADDEISAREGLNLREAKKSIEDAARGIWSLSDLSTHVHLTTPGGNLMTSHSKTLPGAAGCPYSSANAGKMLVA